VRIPSRDHHWLAPFTRRMKSLIFLRVQRSPLTTRSSIEYVPWLWLTKAQWGVLRWVAGLDTLMLNASTGEPR